MALIMLFTIALNAAELVSHRARFDFDRISITHVGDYDRITYDGGLSRVSPGEPELPSVLIRLAVPSGMTATAVRATGVDYEDIPGEFHLIPGQYPIKFDDSPLPEWVPPKESIYGSDIPYPESPLALVSQGDLEGQSVVTIQVVLIRYVPAENKIEFLKDIKFDVDGAPSEGLVSAAPAYISEAEREKAERYVKSLVDNDEAVHIEAGTSVKGATSLPSPGPFDHVIIAPSSLAPVFQPLVNWRTRSGLRDTVVTTQWIRANYAGPADSMKFRDFIIDAYSNWSTRYVLLNGENDSIPFAIRTYDMNTASSDQYYGDFDDDWFYEVAIGRVTEDNAQRLGWWVNKALTYETSPPLDEYSRSLCFLGMDLDTILNTAGEELKIYLDTAVLPAGMNLTRIYDSYPTDHRSAFLAALNEGQNIVNHWEHGGYYSLGTGFIRHQSAVEWGDLLYIGNTGRYTTMVVFACDAGKMNYSTDCIGETFLFLGETNGGVAFVGNAGVGYYAGGQPISYSGELDVLWWQGLLVQDEYRIGNTLRWVKDNAPLTNESYQWCDWIVNLIGDPAMPLWTDSIHTMIVTHNSTTSPGPGFFPVHVEDAGQPVESVYVCLWKGQQVYERGYTDAGGDLVLGIRPDTPGEILVTATKHNYLPYQDSVSVMATGADLNALWEASSQVLPEASCPEWTLTENGSPSPPSFVGDSLALNTTIMTDDQYYSMYSPVFVPTDTIIVQFGVRFVSGSTSNPPRAACAVSLSTGSNMGILFGINQDDIFLWSDVDVIGDEAAVDTDDSLHIYRLVALPSGDVSLYRDDSLTLVGSLFTDPGWGADVGVTWGDRFSEAYSVSRWSYIGYQAVDADSDGVVNGCDNCPDVYNPDQSDGNGNGVGDVCDGIISVLNTDDSGPGSLNWAISVANTLTGLDTITFAVSGDINLATPLPALVDDSTVILGSTAPDGIWSVILDGTLIGGGNDGLAIQSSDNTIEGLTIVNFPGNGITVSGGLSIRNRLTQNVIYNNSGLAIDLGADGVTVNDPGDVDTGPNDLLNYPAIDSINSRMDERFDIYGRAPADAVVEIFVAHPASDASRPADPSGHGEACQYLGQVQASPTGEFSYTTDTTVRMFSILTCSAIDPSGNTSELSENFMLMPRPLIIVTSTFYPQKHGLLPQNGINMFIEDPNGDTIGMDENNVLTNQIAGAEYIITANDDDSVHIPAPVLGDYEITYIPEAAGGTAPMYESIIRVDGSQQVVIVIDSIPAMGEVNSASYTYGEGCDYLNADANSDEAINIADPVYLIAYIFKGGPPPQPLLSGDANCDLHVNIGDAVYIINYVFKGGPAPCYTPQ